MLRHYIHFNDRTKFVPWKYAHSTYCGSDWTHLEPISIFSSLSFSLYPSSSLSNRRVFQWKRSELITRFHLFVVGFLVVYKSTTLVKNEKLSTKMTEWNVFDATLARKCQSRFFYSRYSRADIVDWAEIFLALGLNNSWCISISSATFCFSFFCLSRYMSSSDMMKTIYLSISLLPLPPLLPSCLDRTFSALLDISISCLSKLKTFHGIFFLLASALSIPICLPFFISVSLSPSALSLSFLHQSLTQVLVCSPFLCHFRFICSKHRFECSV